MTDPADVVAGVSGIGDAVSTGRGLVSETNAETEQGSRRSQEPVLPSTAASAAALSHDGAGRMDAAGPDLSQIVAVSNGGDEGHGFDLAGTGELFRQLRPLFAERRDQDLSGFDEADLRALADPEQLRAAYIAGTPHSLTHRNADATTTTVEVSLERITDDAFTATVTATTVTTDHGPGSGESRDLLTDFTLIALPTRGRGMEPFNYASTVSPVHLASAAERVSARETQRGDEETGSPGRSLSALARAPLEPVSGLTPPTLQPGSQHEEMTFSGGGALVDTTTAAGWKSALDRAVRVPGVFTLVVRFVDAEGRAWSSGGPLEHTDAAEAAMRLGRAPGEALRLVVAALAPGAEGYDHPGLVRYVRAVGDLLRLADQRDLAEIGPSGGRVDAYLPSATDPAVALIGPDDTPHEMTDGANLEWVARREWIRVPDSHDGILPRRFHDHDGRLRPSQEPWSPEAAAIRVAVNANLAHAACTSPTQQRAATSISQSPSPQWNSPKRSVMRYSMWTTPLSQRSRLARTGSR